jgi:hypothetical protein
MLIARGHARERAKWWLDIVASNSTSWDVRVREFAEDSLTDLLLAISRESQDEEPFAEENGQVASAPTTTCEGEA